MYETMDSRKKGIAPVVNFADGLAVAAVSMEWNSFCRQQQYLQIIRHS